MSPAPERRHAYRVFALLLALLAAGLVIRRAAVPKSFGKTGHYRAEAPQEIGARLPRHVGEATCARCHGKQTALHDKDAHARVPCEDCHGPGQAHARTPSTKLRVPKGKALCLACHQRLDARASFFPQIEPTEHFRKVGAKTTGAGPDCIRCHDPHEPLFMDRDLRTARLHPLVHRCRDCHVGSSRDASTPRPADHPAIFECGYCHKEIAAEHAQRSHKQVECTSCHLFFRESEFAGRIVRDADPRFCLLCHRKSELRGDKPPAIEWPQHRSDMDGKPDAVCADCHGDHIHHFARAGGKKDE
jgi:hypothetical protein